MFLRGDAGWERARTSRHVSPRPEPDGACKFVAPVVKVNGRSLPVFTRQGERPEGSAHGKTGSRQRTLDGTDPQGAEVEDGGGEDRVGSGLDGRGEVVEPAGATGGDHRDGDLAA